MATAEWAPAARVRMMPSAFGLRRTDLVDEVASWLDWKKFPSMPIWVQHSSGSIQQTVVIQLTSHTRLGEVHHVDWGHLMTKNFSDASIGLAVTASSTVRAVQDNGVCRRETTRRRSPASFSGALGAGRNGHPHPPSAHPGAGRGRAGRRSDAAPADSRPLDDAACRGSCPALFGKAGGQTGPALYQKPSSPSAAKMSGMLRPSARRSSSGR